MPSAAVRDEGALQMRPAPCGYSSAHIFETILFFLLQKEKNGFNLPRKERGPVRTVVLNLTQGISDLSCPSRLSLPPERSLRSAHRGVRRSQLHSVSAGAAKAPYPLAPSSFPNCDRCAGSQFGTGGQSRPPLRTSRKDASIHTDKKSLCFAAEGFLLTLRIRRPWFRG